MASPESSGSIASAAVQGRQAGVRRKRKIRSAIARASLPESRTIPSPPRPGGVEMATMVSRSCTVGSYCAGRNNPSGAGANLRSSATRASSIIPPPVAPLVSALIVASRQSRRTAFGGRTGSGGPHEGRGWELLHIFRYDCHLPVRRLPHALTADASLIAQGKMQNAALAAIHRTEQKRHPGLSHFFGSGKRAQPELFYAHQAMIIRIKADQGVLVRRHAESFRGQLLQRQKQLRLVFEQQIDVRSGEFHQNVRRFEIFERA